MLQKKEGRIIERSDQKSAKERRRREEEGRSKSANLIEKVSRCLRSKEDLQRGPPKGIEGQLGFVDLAGKDRRIRRLSSFGR